jgi:hypothetical protein
MRSKDYGRDVLAGPWTRRRAVQEVPAAVDDVVEHVATGFCGAVVEGDAATVTLEDRHGRRRVFPLEPAAFSLEGETVTLTRLRPAVTPRPPARTASGSVAAPPSRAKVAVASRLFVEGSHDAQLVERLWGDDLRDAGVVVEILDGADHLPDAVAAFRPGPQARMGVLLDHLVAGSKESRITAQVRSPHVLVVGHPFVDVWQAVQPQVVGLDAWPAVPRGLDWKSAVAAHLGQPDVPTAWRWILGRVRDYTDLEPALLGPVEQLIDFVTAPHTDPA